MRNLDTEFPVTASHTYLNHAAVAPWPRRTAAAVVAFAEENLLHGAAHYPKWLETETRLRGLAARLINAPSPDDIALLKNTSEGLSIVAHGLAWQTGENVVGIRQEFPSNRVVWESLANSGVEFRALDLDATDDPEAGLVELCDENTRLLAVSAVQFATGLRLDLDRLGRFCRANGILFCVDAIQQIGALPFDAQAVNADFVVADGHKWMLGPEGVALFYSRPGVREQLRLFQFGWHMRTHPGDYGADSPWEVSPTATRFECGSPNMLGIHALTSSLDLLLEQGMNAIGRAVTERADLLTRWAAGHPGFELLSPLDPARRAGIVSIRHPSIPAADLAEGLIAAGVVCAVRGGGLRLSPHFYTPLQQLERTCKLLEKATA